MMKVSFTLESDQRLILRVLRETGRIHYPVLERVLNAVETHDSDLDTFVKIVAGKTGGDCLFGLSEPKLTPLERTIEGLVFVGLVKHSLHSDPGSSVIFRTQDVGLTDDDIELTSEGERVAKSIKEERRLVLRPAPTRRTTVFIACAFGHDEIDQLCDKHLVPACEGLGYKPLRIDMTEPKQSITDAILEGITECASVIADLTQARPSVYFEVGFAHGLGIPLLLTCRADHHRGKAEVKKVHFDLEQYKISFWTLAAKGGFRWQKNMKPSSRLSALLPERKD